ncbi:hypothetical protein TNCV_1367891 [Trichonephila clavipes]|nr:hypothetical protein TNCV_1367891 [Trichonephila clavipes]
MGIGDHKAPLGYTTALRGLSVVQHMRFLCHTSGGQSCVRCKYLFSNEGSRRQSLRNSERYQGARSLRMRVSFLTSHIPTTKRVDLNV